MQVQHLPVQRMLSSLRDKTYSASITRAVPMLSTCFKTMGRVELILAVLKDENFIKTKRFLYSERV